MAKRYSGVQCRSEGRTLTGPALVYGDVSPTHAETFQAGAFRHALDGGATQWLDVEHDRSRLLAWSGAGLELTHTDEGLQVRAELPKTPIHDAALRMVRDGKLNGFSVEFHERESRTEGGITVVTRADLDGIGLVREPSYTQSVAQVRARGFRLSGRIPFNRAMTCRCHRGACDTVRFKKNAFDDAIDDDTEILMITGEFDSAMASKSKKTLRLRKDDEALHVDVDLPATQAADDLAARSKSVSLLTRPVFDQELSEFVEKDGVAEYSKVKVKAILVGASNVEGWPSAVVTGKSARKRAAWQFAL